MPSLLPADFISCFCFFDDLVKELGFEYTTGRPPVLQASEVITILVWNTVVLKQVTLKDIWQSLRTYHLLDFNIPAYSTFIQEAHRALPLMSILLSFSLVPADIVFTDSTFLEVCSLHRVNHYKVAKDIVAFGKNHQGWHYGFKLHAAINEKGQFAAVIFTPGNVYDAQALPKLVKKYMKILVGDSHYNARVMRERIWKEYGIVIVAPPHHTQRTKLAAWWQTKLLSLRSKIESVFDYLKEHLHIVSSFPRSLRGYFVHYVRILLGYQFGLAFGLATEPGN